MQGRGKEPVTKAVVVPSLDMGRARVWPQVVEWPTLALLVGCYGVWALATGLLWAMAPIMGIVAAALSITLFSSLQHEALHGHPFRSARLNEALVFPALALFVPYRRFRDTHLDHHRDETLTDPYDDPETNYLDPVRWARLPGWLRRVLRVNNTLLGRVILGPAISTFWFLRDDWRAIRRGDKSVRLAWALHVPGVALVLVWLIAVAGMPVWAYLVAAYLGFGILKIRTFLEHRAHEKARGRSVVIEDRGPLAFLFLNNNFHALHHSHPRLPWYALPKTYAERRDMVVEKNDGYVYRSYAEIILRHAFRAKDPVPHPLRPKR